MRTLKYCCYILLSTLGATSYAKGLSPILTIEADTKSSIASVPTNRGGLADIAEMPTEEIIEIDIEAFSTIENELPDLGTLVMPTEEESVSNLELTINFKNENFMIFSSGNSKRAVVRSGSNSAKTIDNILMDIENKAILIK